MPATTRQNIFPHGYAFSSVSFTYFTCERNTCSSMSVDVSLSNLMSLCSCSGLSKKLKKDGRRKEFVLAELIQMNKYETITKLLGTSVFSLLVDICIPLSKANMAF